MKDCPHIQQPLERVTLCANSGCCPDAVFEPDGFVQFEEFGQTVRLSRESVERLLDQITSDRSATKTVTLDCSTPLGCCPAATFDPDGSVVLSESGQSVKLSRSSIDMFLQELKRRGLAT